MDKILKNELSKKMTKAMDILDREFSGLRTGRASVHLLDSTNIRTLIAFAVHHLLALSPL